MNQRLRAAFAALTCAMFLVPLAARADDAAAYSPQDLYDAAHRRSIDSGCTPARAAADRLSKGAPVAADEALGFERAFVACANRRTVSPDIDKLRYLSLAAAGAAYLEAQGSEGPRRTAALARGFEWSDQLAPTSGASQLATTLERNSAGGTGAAVSTTPNERGFNVAAAGPDKASGPVAYQYRTSHQNPFGGNASWLYGGDSARLRDAFAAVISAPARRQAAAPTEK